MSWPRSWWRFLDMPVVNIGTAQNLFRGLKDSLEKVGLQCHGFHVRYSRSWCSDVGCICHLSDLTIKAGLQELPISIDRRMYKKISSIDQLFIGIFYHFYHRHQQFADLWRSLFSSERLRYHPWSPQGTFNSCVLNYFSQPGWNCQWWHWWHRLCRQWCRCRCTGSTNITHVHAQRRSINKVLI